SCARSTACRNRSSYTASMFRARSAARPCSIFQYFAAHISSMCSCLDSLTTTSANGVDLPSPQAIRKPENSAMPSMHAKVPKSGKRVQHFLVLVQEGYGFTECLHRVEACRLNNLSNLPC